MTIPGQTTIATVDALRLHDSRWALMSAIVFDGDQPRMTPAGHDFISVVMRTTEVEIIDTWDSLGMPAGRSSGIWCACMFMSITGALLERKARRARGPQTRPERRRTSYAYCLPAVVALATASSLLDSRVDTMWSTMCSASRPTPPTSAELSE